MARSKTEGISKALVLLSAALLAVSCASGLEGGPVLLHPVPPAAGPYRMTGGAITFDGPDFRVSARPVDWRVAEECYGKEAGDLSGYVFISLRFENSSRQSIFFNPVRTTLYTRKRSFSVPIDSSDIYFMNREDPDLEGRIKKYRELSYDGSTTVVPGGAEERHLVFPVPSGKLETLELVLDDLHVGTRSFDLSFLFEAFPVEEEPSGR
jgi:hypothetical protein